ncbi:MAG: alpha/beta fold hydrolase [Myxococcales bacterium]|nr:alpha/beta fold hydrolase [Myxococcales bacterium]
MQAVLDLSSALVGASVDAAQSLLLGGPVMPPPTLAPTARDTVFADGTARVYRFRRAEGAPAAPRRPVLLVPSMINKWYVLDLRKGASFVEALVAAGHEVFVLDWGTARDEDRDLTWAEVIARLARVVRFVRRSMGVDRVGILGYCMGATLSSIYTALHPTEVAALVNLAGPIDFSYAGLLRDMVDARWFDPAAVAAAGNVSPSQMQSGFTAMRPTLTVAKWFTSPDRLVDKRARDSFYAIDTWSGDNIPFPGAAYETYITELYQQNALVHGRHYVGGRRVALDAITCPVLTIGSERDTICPLAAATALHQHVGTRDVTVLTVPGGHVGAVVGSRASAALYPSTAAWLRDRLDRV